MHSNPLRKNLKPHLWFQLYWVVYLIWFFWLDLTVKNPKYIIHAPLDDLIPFCEWFVFPYCSWFFLLAGVTALLWWYDTASYDKLCLMMFSGMTFCLLLYMVLPNGLDIRPTAEAIGRDNIAMRIMQMLWNADASVNVCPSIHCQSSGCMALAFSRSKLAQDRPGLKVLAWGWALLICASTVSQNSIPSWMWSSVWRWWPCGYRYCTGSPKKECKDCATFPCIPLDEAFPPGYN